jgi:hypothetical protein
MHKFTRFIVAATAVTLSMLAAASPANALGMGDVITIKSADGSVVVCTPFGCIQTVPPCQCSPKPFEKVATPTKPSGTTGSKFLGKQASGRAGRGTCGRRGR